MLAATAAVPAGAAAGTSIVQFVAPEELTACLTSINSNLACIATALELLATHPVPKPLSS